MRPLFYILFLMFINPIQAQELFVVTEPASSMPSGAVSTDVGQTLMKRELKKGYDYHLFPEVAWGINKNWMVRATVFLSNRTQELKYEGASVYTKYRFFSVDEMHNHFRMAAFGRFSINKSDIHQDMIETMGHNTGYETGLIFTKLVKRVAVSTSVSYEKALDNDPDYPFPKTQSDNATNYSLSVGRLFYPKQYDHFKQTNINLMMEFVGQTLNGNGKSYLDVVPSIQFIVNSQAKINLAYSKELYSSMERTAPNGFLLKFEYTFFNVTK